MNRQGILLGAVAAVLVFAVYWMFLFSPKREEYRVAQDATASAIQEQGNLTTQINTLRDVRARAPQVEAQLAATEALIPSGPALSPTLRQLQLAADESGLDLIAVAPGPPAALVLEGLPAGAASMSLSLQLSGSYFQIIDFLRRIEDPTITPRAILWNSMSIGPSDYPTLSLTVLGTMFTLDRSAVDANQETS